MSCRQISLPTLVWVCVIVAAVCRAAVAERSADVAQCAQAAGEIRAAFVVCGNPPNCPAAPHDTSIPWVADTTNFISNKLPKPFNLSEVTEDSYDLYLEQIYLRAYADCMRARQ